MNVTIVCRTVVPGHTPDWYHSSNILHTNTPTLRHSDTPTWGDKSSRSFSSSAAACRWTSVLQVRGQPASPYRDFAATLWCWSNRPILRSSRQPKLCLYGRRASIHGEGLLHLASENQVTVESQYRDWKAWSIQLQSELVNLERDPSSFKPSPSFFFLDQKNSKKYLAGWNRWIHFEISISIFLVGKNRLMFKSFLYEYVAKRSGADFKVIEYWEFIPCCQWPIY